MQYGNELLSRAIEVIVHHDFVVAITQMHLALGGMQAKLERLRRFRSAADQALTQNLERRGLDEDETA